MTTASAPLLEVRHLPAAHTAIEPAGEPSYPATIPLAIPELRAAAKPQFRRILGLNFFIGSAREAIEQLHEGGLIVLPAAPALKNLAEDSGYREALLKADFVITDSGFMVLLWNLLQGDSIHRVSGLGYMRELLKQPEVHQAHNTFWIMANPDSAATNMLWLISQGIEVGVEDLYVAPSYGVSIEDHRLLERLRTSRPRNIVVTLGGGTQERLGLYLKQNLSYRPAIHCTGAAIAFLSGDQVHIPGWADRLTLGWLFRCISSPRRYCGRYWGARKLASMMFHYRDRLPVA